MTGGSQTFLCQLKPSAETLALGGLISTLLIRRNERRAAVALLLPILPLRSSK